MPKYCFNIIACPAFAEKRKLGKLACNMQEEDMWNGWLKKEVQIITEIMREE